MSGYGNVELNIFSIMILLVIYENMRRRSREYLPDQRLFLLMIIVDALTLFTDSLQWIFDGIPGPVSYYVNLIGTAAYYVLQDFPCLCWCLYVRYQIKMDVKEMFRAKALLYIPFVLNMALSILSCFYGFYFYIDSQNFYHRGQLFWLSVVITYGYFLYSTFYLIFERKKTEKNIFAHLMFFTMPPIIGSVIQVFNFGCALIWPGVTLSLLMIYINIQNNQLYTDYLTGLYNRRLMDIHLDDCLGSGGRKFGVIMIDIDRFKEINDLFGHVIGDQALVETANILKKSVGKKGFTARYGGDEFIVIAPADDIEEVQAIAKEIERKTEVFNRHEGNLYAIHLSMGYDLFECRRGITKSEVLSRIDRHMYEEKYKERIPADQMSIE